jgi:hypothetical protein
MPRRKPTSQQLVPVKRGENHDELVRALVQFVRKVADNDDLTSEEKVDLAREVFSIRKDAVRAQNEVARLYWERQVIEEEGKHALLLAQRRSEWALEQAAAEEASRHALAVLRHEQLVEEAQLSLAIARQNALPTQAVDQTAIDTFRTLKRDCESIVLDVRTGTVLLDKDHLYHGFAALTYERELDHSTEEEAAAFTVAALIQRRQEHNDMTIEDAARFEAQYRLHRQRQEYAVTAQVLGPVIEQLMQGEGDAYRIG